MKTLTNGCTSQTDGVEVRVDPKFKRPLFQFITAHGIQVNINSQCATAFIDGSHKLASQLLVRGLQEIGCTRVRVSTYGSKAEYQFIGFNLGSELSSPDPRNSFDIGFTCHLDKIVITKTNSI